MTDTRELKALDLQIDDRLKRLERQSDFGRVKNVPANISTGLLWETCQDVRLFLRYRDEVQAKARAQDSRCGDLLGDKAISGWIADLDTLPPSLIQATRGAIQREFGDNGTDGYYKRILGKVLPALRKAIAAFEASHEK
jgi:hypothetical protein